MPELSANPDLLPLLRGVSRSFYLSIRVLPSALRQPIAIAYLLARATDTLADTGNAGRAERAAMLASLAGAIDGANSAICAADIASSFAPLQDDPDERQLIRALPQCLAWLEQLAAPDRDDVRAVLRHITRGQLLDLERFVPGTTHALGSAAELDEYTYLVAGCVGEFWTDLCFRHLPAFATLPQDEMRELGRRYGMALQLVNILRDAGADLAAGRCYFPADQLAQAGIAPADIARRPEAFEAVWRPWQARAQGGLEAGMRYADAVRSRRVRVASALPALIATRTLALLLAAGPRRLQHKVKVPRREVRALLTRMALTFGSRGQLRSSYERWRPEPAAERWDNPRP
jgi:farnesyl-diphosphate farnesyltransferase